MAFAINSAQRWDTTPTSASRIWLVTFMHCDFGYFDDEVGRLQPIANPFGSKVLPMCSE
jgi:hypothetical protein